MIVKPLFFQMPMPMLHLRIDDDKAADNNGHRRRRRRRLGGVGLVIFLLGVFYGLDGASFLPSSRRSTTTLRKASIATADGIDDDEGSSAMGVVEAHHKQQPTVMTAETAALTVAANANNTKTAVTTEVAATVPETGVNKKDEDDNEETEEDDSDKKVKYYIHARHDRSGRHLIFFYLLDAKAFADGALVGGACDDEAVVGASRWSDRLIRDFHARVQDVKGLLKMLRLDHHFRYACPTKRELKSGEAVMLKWNRHLKPTEDYLTDAWHRHFVRHHVRSHDDEPSARVDGERRRLRIAVHVRRGDLTPCHVTPTNARRYIPNAAYLRLLDDYLPRYCGNGGGGGGGSDYHERCDVVIHSESRALEPFDAFAARGYRLDLDGDLETVWKSLIHADVLIAADSAFSYVPAVLNRNVVLFPPSEDKDYSALPGWTVFDQEYLTRAHDDWQRLRDGGCRYPQ